MKRIVITANHPVGNDGSLEHLIGREFDVKQEDDAGYYIGYGITKLYHIKKTECEIVREES